MIIKDELLRLFRIDTPRLYGPEQPRPRGLRVTSSKEQLIGFAGDGSPLRVAIPDAPSPSYQWLFFDTLDGAVPAGPQVFTFRGQPIPFVGAITEVHVTATEPGVDWQMRVSIDGLGSLFKTTQPTDQLQGDGWFRPTPLGFWPETEGIVFPLSSPGQVPVIEFFRADGQSPNLTVRVFIVAHPAE